jgi:hypothetical protein
MLARGMHVEDRVNPVKEPYTFSDGFSSRFVWICRVAVFLTVSDQSPLRSKSNGGGERNRVNSSYFRVARKWWTVKSASGVPSGFAR